eukprot:5125613-Amphidinium_carterae.1
MEATVDLAEQQPDETPIAAMTAPVQPLDTNSARTQQMVLDALVAIYGKLAQATYTSVDRLRSVALVLFGFGKLEFTIKS